MSFQDSYERFEWELRLIGSSVVYILFLIFLGSYVFQNTTPIPTNYENTVSYTFTNSFEAVPLLYYTIVLVVIAIVLPFFLSLIFSKKDVDLAKLKIVPPFYIAMFGIIFMLLFVIKIQNNFFPVPGGIPSDYEATLRYLRLPSVFVLAVFGLFSFYEDPLSVIILGRSASSEMIFFEKLLVRDSIDEVLGKLTIPEVLNNLFLSPNVEGDKIKGYTLSTTRAYDFKTKINLEPNEASPIKETIVKVAYYQQSRYSTRLDDYFKEETRKHSAYLHELFAQRDRKMVTETLVPLNNSTHDLFISSIIDELRGFYVQSKKYSYWDWYKLLIIGAVSILTAVLFFLGLSRGAEIIGAIDFLIIAFEVPDIIRRRSIR